MFETDYTITGKHATYLKSLAVKNANRDNDDEVKIVHSAQLFERYIDVYMNAAIWGLLYKRREERDTISKDRARIYADAFARERNNCIFLYRLVMLLDESTNLNAEERVNRAFRYDTMPDKVEEFKNNMDLFHAYIRGGIEQMYEQFTDGCSNRGDYLNTSYKVMIDFKKDIEGFSYKDELPTLINQTELNLNM